MQAPRRVVLLEHFVSNVRQKMFEYSFVCGLNRLTNNAFRWVACLQPVTNIHILTLQDIFMSRPGFEYVSLFPEMHANLQDVF